MCHRLVLGVVLIDLMAGVEIKGDEGMILVSAEFSKHNVSHIKGILKLTILLDEFSLWILGKYLTQFRLSNNSRQPLEDSQRVKYYRLNTEDIAFANPYHQ